VEAGEGIFACHRRREAPAIERIEILQDPPTALIGSGYRMEAIARRVIVRSFSHLVRENKGKIAHSQLR